MSRLLLLAAALTFLASSCGGTSADISGVPDLPEATTEGLVASIRAASQPAVVNVWASWCGPCRSEAPLLSAAAGEFSDRVTFVGLNVRDSQDDAKGFIVEFLEGAPIDHIYDRDGSTVADLGGTTGVPLTFFMNADGTVSKIHFGVIDERTLALEVDELMKAGA
ncbi:MAG: redoxin family protein [Acidimicrobiia bacterium]|nr:redoxin family protein [Acidimicrobiia bacterium]